MSDRIPLSDETPDLDEDVVEEFDNPEESYDELDFDRDPETEYDPPIDEDDFMEW